MEVNSFKPIFVIGPGNCGYELFVSLLDDHQEIVVTPFTIKYYNMWKILKLDQETNLEEIKRILLEQTKLMRLKEGSYEIQNPFYNNIPNTKDFSKFKTDLFEKNFLKFFETNKINRKNILIATYMSYAVAIGKDLSKIKGFFIDAMYTDNIKEILSDFRDAKFLYLMRDPRDNFLSLNQYFFNRKHSMTPLRDVNKNLYLHIFEDYLSKNYNMLKKLRSNKSIDLKIIKFEDIQLIKEQVIREICNKYNFKFEKILLDTTVFGNKSINLSSFSSEIVTGVSKERIQRYKTKLSFFTLILIEKIFLNTLKDNNYEISIKNNYFYNLLFLISYLFPLKNELLPSNLIFRTIYKEKLKNNILFKITKYLFYFTWNILFYFINRLLVNFKFYLIRV